MQKFIIFIITFFSLIPGVFASENWKLEENKNTLSIAGDCLGKEVSVELYQVGKNQPIYNSGSLCREGKFEFSDNLLQWKSLEDGQYEVVIDGDRKNNKHVSIERVVENVVAEIPEVSLQQPTPTQEVVAQTSQAEAKAEPETPELKFLGAFVNMQQAILDMRQWLDQTNYPNLAKQTIGIALDGLDLAVGKLSGKVMSSENVQPDNEALKIQNESSKVNENDALENVSEAQALEQVSQIDIPTLDYQNGGLEIQ